ncbi:hypothetical protein CHELA20_10057 [Hyphomicrobiales bacterium]|nr:hypothetical protein CHELA20_10057 [Hyphomicrobiales bacterium]CAH1690302.1 hypothetical protein CHELA41_50283 [Hyphomicrobiales bacterium]
MGATNCRSSTQMMQRSGGASPGAYCVPQVTQMNAVMALAPGLDLFGGYTYSASSRRSRTLSVAGLHRFRWLIAGATSTAQVKINIYYTFRFISADDCTFSMPPTAYIYYFY